MGVTAVHHDRLHRVLQLALTSPYEGEREKAVALFLSLLERTELSLHQLDRSFAPGDGANELRKRVGLPFSCVRSVKSREEAALYRHLVQRSAGPDTPVQTAEVADGYELTCTLTLHAKERTDQAFAAARDNLPEYLAAAQQLALREYQARRKVLFNEAIQALASSTLPG